jgi:membrane-associated protease RseP (regulator of RpoE activity)
MTTTSSATQFAPLAIAVLGLAALGFRWWRNRIPRTLLKSYSAEVAFRIGRFVSHPLQVAPPDGIRENDRELIFRAKRASLSVYLGSLALLFSLVAFSYLAQRDRLNRLHASTDTISREPRAASSDQDLGASVRLRPHYEAGELRGIEVIALGKQSVLALHGVAEGDVIVELNGQKIDSVVAAQAALTALTDGSLTSTNTRVTKLDDRKSLLIETK